MLRVNSNVALFKICPILDMLTRNFQKVNILKECSISLCILMYWYNIIPISCKFHIYMWITNCWKVTSPKFYEIEIILLRYSLSLNQSFTAGKWHITWTSWVWDHLTYSIYCRKVTNLLLVHFFSVNLHAYVGPIMLAVLLHALPDIFN